MIVNDFSGLQKVKLAAVKAKRDRWKSAKAKANAKVKTNKTAPEDTLELPEDKAPQSSEPKKKKRKVDAATTTSESPQLGSKVAQPSPSSAPARPKKSKSKDKKTLTKQPAQNEKSQPLAKKPRYFSRDGAGQEESKNSLKKAKRREKKERKGDVLQIFD